MNMVGMLQTNSLQNTKIQAKKHKIGTYEIDKISLSCFDDKKYVLDDGVNTSAYFHKDSNKKCDNNKGQ